MVLTVKALTYIYTNQANRKIFSKRNHHKCLSYFFALHLNTNVMGLLPLNIVYSVSAGIVFVLQNLTSIDVRF